MPVHTANSIRTQEALTLLRWCKARLLAGPQMGALINALHTAVFFGLGYVGLTLVTGWVSQLWAVALQLADPQ
jgi:hypothetical protein